MLVQRADWDLAIFTSSTTSFQVGSLPSKEQHATVTHIVVVPAITHVFSYPLHCYQQCITDRKPVGSYDGNNYKLPCSQ